GSDAVLDLTNISKLYLWLGYEGSTGSSSDDNATILVDNIEVVVGEPSDLVDDFELYDSNAQLQVYYPWVGAISGNSPAIALADSGGSDKDRALKIDFGFDAGTVDPYAYAGGPVAINARNWTGYEGLRLWVKGSVTGDISYIDIAIHEGDSTGAWGDKFGSAPIALEDLDPNGQYVYLDFDDFTRYSGFGGTKDNGVLDLTDIRSVFVRNHYSGTATQNSTASVYVDDIKLGMTPVVNIPPTPGIVTYLNNNFDGYTNDAAMKDQWLSWSYTEGATVSYNLDTGTNGASGENSMLMKLNVADSTVGSAPGTADPTGDASVVVYETTSGGLRGNLVRATAIKVWVNPEGFTSNHSDPFFRVGLAESSTTGGDRWISPRHYLKDINALGEVLIIPINSLTHYLGPDAVLDLTNISKLYLWLGYAGSTKGSAADSATIVVDNIEVVVGETSDLVDDFELYDSDAQLQVYYPWVGAVAGNSPAIALADSGGSDKDRALRIDFGFESGTVDPYAYAGGPVAINARNWTGNEGIRLWLKGNVTGNESYITIVIMEGDSTGDWGDKFSSVPIPLVNLDPDGQYIDLRFTSFTRYGGYGGTKDDGVLDLTDIRSIFVRNQYSGTATQNSSASVLVDDIKLVEKVVSIEQQIAALPEKYALYQNYPNPFNPVTNIRYDLPEASDVKLIIYDILGHEVIRLVDGRMEAGYKSIRWNGRDKFGIKVASGVYIYMLNTDSYVKTKKLLFLK
ncbi:MAG: T9SS type A sorting domain-containing protein, partial [FCB group bacterium]|nr:T9SS type A sorting domain-containing protein [FCB group bacterium]